MESKREDLKASEDRIRKLKERSRHQEEKIGWLDLRINELQELGFTEAKYNPLNYEERVLENQMLYDEITGLSQKIKDLENLHKEIQDECSEDLEHKMREKQKILKELDG
jgi:DNA repair ATPase RecN